MQVVDSGRGSDGVEAQEDGVRAGKPREEGEHFCQKGNRFQVLRELVTHTGEVDKVRGPHRTDVHFHE